LKIIEVVLYTDVREGLCSPLNGIGLIHNRKESEDEPQTPTTAACTRLGSEFGCCCDRRQVQGRRQRTRRRQQGRDRRAAPRPRPPRRHHHCQLPPLNRDLGEESAQHSHLRRGVILFLYTEDGHKKRSFLCHLYILLTFSFGLIFTFFFLCFLV